MPRRHSGVLFVQPALTGATSNKHAVVQERRQFAHPLGLLILISVTVLSAEGSHDSSRTPVV
jgi:hypothetical protein